MEMPVFESLSLKICTDDEDDQERELLAHEQKQEDQKMAMKRQQSILDIIYTEEQNRREQAHDAQVSCIGRSDSLPPTFQNATKSRKPAISAQQRVKLTDRIIYKASRSTGSLMTLSRENSLARIRPSRGTVSEGPADLEMPPDIQ